MSGTAPAVRRPTLHRVPVHRRVFPVVPGRTLPRPLRRLLYAVLALMLAAVALVSCREAEKPTSLAGSVLAGQRLVTGPVCLEVAVDVSGSMDQFRGQRERAERELFAFARRALDEDTLSEAFFASSARIALHPTVLNTLDAPPQVPGGIDYQGTRLTPAVAALISARPSGSAGTCAARALVVISDGLLGDDPAELTGTLARGAYTRIFAVIPAETGWGRPAPLTGGLLDSITVHHFTDSGLSGRIASILADAQPLDVVFGEILSALTGQRLARAQ